MSWTAIDKVCGEVPGFKRGGTRITDTHIGQWIDSVAQSIAAAMMRRGLSLEPADWPAAGSPMDAAAVLEAVNRVGAAARLAAAIASDFSTGEWALAKTLARQFEDEMKRLSAGEYDRVFRQAAATAETGPMFSSGELDSDSAFSKTQRF